MADFTETEQELFDRLCRAADVYQDGLITGDELRSCVVDYTDEIKLSQIEPPFNSEHYYTHTPNDSNPACANCRYVGWSR